MPQLTSRLLMGVLALLWIPLSVQAQESLRIRPLVSGNEVVVSVELADAYTEEIREAVESGLRTSFDYEIDLVVNVPFWADRTVASALASISVEYDGLTGRHSLARRVDGRVLDAIVTEDEDVVREWLTTLTRLPICDTSELEPNRDYYVRIRARSRPSTAGNVLAWASSISGQARFTFIP